MRKPGLDLDVRQETLSGKGAKVILEGIDITNSVQAIKVDFEAAGLMVAELKILVNRFGENSQEAQKALKKIETELQQQQS